MAELTLVGERLAEPDTEFVYQGEAPGCAGCPYRDQCLTLTEGRRYRVTGVRENASTLECAVHAGGVRAVEVEPAPVRANVAANAAFAGNKTALEGSCPHTDCPSHPLCEPAGADFSTEYRITDVVGDPPHEHCMLDRDLSTVVFEPQTED